MHMKNNDSLLQLYEEEKIEKERLKRELEQVKKELRESKVELERQMKKNEASRVSDTNDKRVGTGGRRENH